MERQLEKIMEELTQVNDVTGCLLTDHQGLCLGAKGKATVESAGLIRAIADQVSRLEPDSKHPIIMFESDNKQCIIQSRGNITAAIYKNHTSN